MDLILMQRFGRRQAGNNGSNTNIVNNTLMEPLLERWARDRQQLYMRVRTNFYAQDDGAGGTLYNYSASDKGGRLYMDDIDGLQIGDNNSSFAGRIELTCPDSGPINITGMTTAKITWNAAWGWFQSLAKNNGNAIDQVECQLYLEILKPATYGKNNL